MSRYKLDQVLGFLKLLISKQDNNALMFIKEVKVQNQTKLFYGTRNQNSDFSWAWGVNDHNTAQDSFRGFDNVLLLSNNYTGLFTL